MKKREARVMEADHLADVLLSATNSNQISSVLGQLTPDDIQDLCTSILRSGHTVLHLLAQREKLQALRALLQRGVGTCARDAQGATPLHLALVHSCLNAAKVLIEEGGANVSEVISKRKGTSLLHLMVTCDRPHAVTLLLEHEAEVSRHDAEGRTPFHLAAVYGNSMVAAILLRHERCDVNALDDMGQTALMLAILNDNQDLACQLVDCPRVDVLLKDGKDRSSLHLAVSRGHLEVVRSLLRRNSANLHAKERSMGRTPIHLACALVCSQSGVVTSNCLFDENSRTLNHAAPSAAGTVRQLNGHAQFNCNARLNGSVNRLFLEEERTRKRGSVAWLGKLERVDIQGLVGSWSGEILADMESRLSHISVAVLSPKDNHQDEEGLVNGHQSERSSGSLTSNEEHSATMSARSDVVNGNVSEAVSSKVFATITPRASWSKKHQTPSQQSIKNQTRQAKSQSHFPTVTKAKTTDARSASTPNLRVRHSISGEHVLQIPRPQPITCAFSPQKQMTPGGRKSSIRRPATAPARNRGRFFANVSFADPERSRATTSSSRETGYSLSNMVIRVTPSNIGVIRCRMVSLLLDYGADANLMTTFRKSPLHITAMIGSADVLAVLLPHITNVNVLSASNRTALHLAVERNHVAVASQLIQAGANFSLREITGMTALHIAARFGCVDIVSLLLKARADINITDFKQMAPLHHACLHSHPQVINMLISAGARLDIVDVSGHTPISYRKAASTSDHPGLSPERLDNLNYSNSLFHRGTPTPAKVEKCKMASLCGGKGKDGAILPQPALDFQRPGLLFKKITLQKAS